MTTWWRAYNDSIHNKKLLKLSDAMHRAWYTLQCFTSENDGKLPPAADIATELRIKPSKVAEWITALVVADLYENVDGIFKPKNWETRQYKTDAVDPTGANRSKRYRDRKRDDRDASRSVTGDDTVRSKRPEAETESEQSRADAALRLQNEISEKWNLADVARVPIWLAKGYTETMIIETITVVMARGLKITSAAYFDEPLKAAHANRAPGPSERAEIDYDKVVASWAKTGVWSRWAGPDPSSPACRASPEHFARNGVDREGRKLARSQA